MQPTVIPNLDPAADRGFTLNDGTLAVVRAVQAPAPPGVVAIALTVREVDAAGATVQVNGHEVVTAEERHTLTAEAIAGGTTVPAWLAGLTVAAAPKLPAFKLALGWWATLPVAPPEPSP